MGKAEFDAELKKQFGEDFTSDCSICGNETIGCPHCKEYFCPICEEA